MTPYQLQHFNGLKRQAPNRLVEIYHITKTDNIANIYQHGLLPKIGKNSKDLDEDKPRIYFFSTPVYATDALLNWFGDLYDLDTPLTEITVQLPIKLLNKQANLDWEVTTTQPISSKYIVATENC